MNDGTNRYCDSCWALIIDRGYADKTDLCDSCWTPPDEISYVSELELVELLGGSSLVR